MEHRIEKIPLNKIRVRGDNPRQAFNPATLQELGESFLTHGQLQPIVVRPRDGEYELVVGERRLRAAQIVGLTEIEARIADMDEATVHELRLIENTQREDLTESEKGNAVAHLLAEYPEKYPTIKALAKKLQKADGTIGTWLSKSERLSEKVKNFISRKELPDRVARLLVKFDHATQNKLAEAIIKYEIPQTTKELRLEFVRRYDLNPEKYPTVESLEELANEVKGVKTVKVDLSKLSPEAKAEVEKTLEEAKEEAKKRRAKRPRKPRRKVRRQGRPKKERPKPEPEEERKPLPPLTIPVEIKTVTLAFSFPVPLWERLTRYCAMKTMILQEAIISLLETHSALPEA